MLSIMHIKAEVHKSHVSHPGDLILYHGV